MQDIWKAAGAAAWRAVCFGGLLPFLDEATQAKIAALCPQAGGVYIAAFPYFAGRRAGNLSLYCRGEDYHRVLARRLETVCVALRARHPTHRFLPLVDNSPLPERLLAQLGGLGSLGRNGLLLLPPYGSYLFLGTILTDLPLETAAPKTTVPVCQDCEACLRACPTGALGASGVDATRCLSEISQKKGELSPWEQEALRNSPLIWGCDRCQAACPHNRSAEETSLPEFREHLLTSLCAADLEGLTNRSFQARYGDYAFAWRGPAVLRRNLSLADE